MFFQLYHNREGHSDDPKPMFERNRFYLRYQAPIATRKKKKKCTMLEGTQVVSRDRNSNKQKPAQSNRENVDSSGAVLLFTVICNTLFKKKATRFSEVPWKSSNNWDQQDPNSFLFCIRNARGSYLMGTSADQLGHYRYTAECKPSVFIKVSPLSKVVNTTEKYTDCCHL